MQASWFGALLLSLSVHLGLIVAAGDGARASVKPALSDQALPTPLSLRLVAAPDRLAPALESMPDDQWIDSSSEPPAEPKADPRIVPVQEVAGTSEPATASNPTASSEAQPAEEAPALSVLGLAAAHYFGTDELTERPQLFEDTAPNAIISVPDIFPQPVVVHLLINEQGNIDKVVLEESFLSDPARRFVIDSFAKTRFSPGKVGDLAVKSRLDIVVRLEGALSAL